MKSILATIVALGQVYLLMPLTAMADVPMNLTDANTSLGEIEITVPFTVSPSLGTAI